jgi:hypothetical protein
MARAARAEREVQTADRIAARRSRTAKRPGEAQRRTPPRGVRGRAGGSGSRVFKLGMMVAAFCLVGFFVVLVIDVGARLVGKLDLGGSSIAELVDKVVDRVLDRDVPRARELDKPRSSTPRRSVAPAAPSTARAPRPAVRPEEDARHVEARPDPQVEQAKQRLDELLRRL